MNKYVGHASQIRGAEEHILKGGKGEGMRLLTVRNGKGLDFTISLDRAADISRLSFKGTNMGYFAPCGYVAPMYYNGDFLKSFTAGFFTTCGLTTVGTPTLDDGEDLPLHGTISNIPSEKVSVEETDSGITVKAEIREASLFGRKLVLRNITRYDTLSLQYGLSFIVRKFSGKSSQQRHKTQNGRCGKGRSRGT